MNEIIMSLANSKKRTIDQVETADTDEGMSFLYLP